MRTGMPNERGWGNLLINDCRNFLMPLEFANAREERSRYVCTCVDWCDYVMIINVGINFIRSACFYEL